MIAPENIFKNKYLHLIEKRNKKSTINKKYKFKKT